MNEGNVISGNMAGIVAASNTTIQGNRIGTNATGTTAIPNTNEGISLEGSNSLIGGLTNGQGNLISGNGQDGILLNNANTNTIVGNLIGTDAAGTADLGHRRGEDWGVHVAWSGNHRSLDERSHHHEGLRPTLDDIEEQVLLGTLTLDVAEARRSLEQAEQLGDELGISKERVRQIEAKALEKLKTALLDMNPKFETYARQ